MTISLTEKEIIAALKEGSRLVSRRKPASTKVFEKVEDAMLSKLKELLKTHSSPVKLSLEDANNIAAALILRDKKSPETHLHWLILNDLIEQLINSKILHPDSSYFNLPQQMKRDLVTYIESADMGSISCVMSLRDELLFFRGDQAFSSLEEEEIEYVCSYVASSVCFGKVLIPDYSTKLLMIREKDLCLEPVSVLLPLKGCEGQEHGAFYRNFLPSPASINLLRCMIFYRKYAKELGIKDPGNPDGYVFEHFLPKLKKFPKIFRRWFVKKMEALGRNVKEGMSLSIFRDAAIDMTVLESITDGHTQPAYPPFLISIQSGDIRTASCVPSHFMLSPDQMDKADYSFPRRSVGHIREKRVSPLSQAFRTLNIELKPLTKKSSLGQRREIASRMRMATQLQEDLLPSGAFSNLMLACEFVCRMLSFKKDNSKSKIRNHLTAAKTFLLTLPEDVSFSTLPKDQIIDAVESASAPYKSNFIINGCQAFFDFVRSHLGDPFPVISLQASTMKKKKLQFPEPIIYPFQVKRVLQVCDEVFCKRALSMKDKEKRNSDLRKAKHRAAMAEHMIHHGYYGSDRESEFTGLRIRDVIFDEDGHVMCIRDSKTDNGKRNIPLFPLFPDSYQARFDDYYARRLSEASSGDDWLFPDYDGNRLDAGSMAKRIQAVFKHIGISNMVFHDLRKGFGNFLLLRLFHAFYPELFSDDLPILEAEMFKEPYVDRLKKLILGEISKIGQEHVNHGIAALSILIGHGGSITTFEEYINTADWLFYLISRSLENFRVPLTLNIAENLLQVSHPTLPKSLKGRGAKLYRDILAGQIERIKKMGLLNLISSNRKEDNSEGK